MQLKMIILQSSLFQSSLIDPFRLLYRSLFLQSLKHVCSDGDSEKPETLPRTPKFGYKPCAHNLLYFYHGLLGMYSSVRFDTCFFLFGNILILN